MRWLPLLLLAGCAFDSSSSGDTAPKPARDPMYSADVATSEMVPSMSAESYGDGIRVYGALLARGVFVTLSEGDYMTASIGNETLVLVRQQNPDPGKVRYEASFPQLEPAPEVTIRFHRPSGKKSAEIKVPIPPAFTVTAENTTIKKGETLKLQVTPPPVFKSSTSTGPLIDHMRLVVIGPCIKDNEGYAVTMGTDGGGTVSTNLVTITSNEGCDVTFLLRRQVVYRSPEGFSTSNLLGVEAMQGRSFSGKMLPP
jgi:hypothetical protein